MEAVGSTQYRGSVTVVWGSGSGLSGGTNVPPKSGAGSYFGRDLATGDFNGDGSPDLAAIGGEEAWLYRGGFTKSGTTGSVSKIDKTGQGWYSSGFAAGKVNGDGKTDLVVLGTQFVDNKPVPRVWFLKGASGGLTSGASKTYASDPWTAAIGDFNKDGYGDIAVGLPDNNDGKGIVSVWRGTSLGPSGSMTYNQAGSGVSGSPEADDNFGYAVSAGDTDGDGYADLAVGVPQEDVNGLADQGGVHVFRGGSGGLCGSRSSWIPQTVQGRPADSYESFGSPLRVRDVTGDGKADLAIGAANVSVLLRGASGGPTTSGPTELPELNGPFSD